MKHALTKKVQKDLRILASRLPIKTTGQKTTNWVSGTEILSKNPDAKMKTGEPIEAGKWYCSESEIPAENHYKRMCNLYKIHGKEGVSDYLQKIIGRETAKQAA